MARVEASAPVRSRGGSVLVAAVTVDSIGNGLFTPLSLVYFVRLTSVPLVLVGVLLTVANLAALPIPIWAGTLADRIGPLRLVVASELTMAVGFLAYAAVTGPVGILVAAMLVAVGVRVFWCTIFTLVADYADGRPGGRGVDAWYAISNAARTAGLALGGLTTGLVVADGSASAYRGVAYGAAVCLAVAGALVATGVRAPHREAVDGEPVGYRELVRDRPYLGLVALNTVYAMTSMMLAITLPTVVLAGAGPVWLTAVLLAANAVLITVLSAPIVRRLGRVRRTRSVAVAAGLWTVWCVLMAVVGVQRRFGGDARAGRRHAALHRRGGDPRPDLDRARRGDRADRRPRPLPVDVPVLVRDRLGDRARLLRGLLRDRPRDAVPRARRDQRGERARPAPARAQPARPRPPVVEDGRS